MRERERERTPNTVSDKKITDNYQEKNWWSGAWTTERVSSHAWFLTLLAPKSNLHKEQDQFVKETFRSYSNFRAHNSIHRRQMRLVCFALGCKKSCPQKLKLVGRPLLWRKQLLVKDSPELGPFLVQFLARLLSLCHMMMIYMYFFPLVSLHLGLDLRGRKEWSTLNKSCCCAKSIIIASQW